MILLMINKNPLNSMIAGDHEAIGFQECKRDERHGKYETIDH